MVIGVDLGGTNVRAGVSSNGKIVQQKAENFKSNGSQGETLDQLKGLIRSLIAQNISGIGLGVPSVVDVEAGIVYNVTNIPSWDRVPLKEILEDEFSLPVAVNNDVNCFILGEHRHGKAKGFKNVVGITSGTGLGAGIIINNELFYGNNCGAGEIGLLSYRDHTIEYYASGNFFQVEYNMTAIEAHQLAAQGNSMALRRWKAFGAHMGQAIKTVVYSYDPEAIVIGGSLSKAFDFFREAMYESLTDFMFPQSIKRLKIFQSIEENITLLGAASLIEQNVSAPLKV